MLITYADILNSYYPGREYMNLDIYSWPCLDAILFFKGLSDYKKISNLSAFVPPCISAIFDLVVWLSIYSDYTSFKPKKLENSSVSNKHLTNLSIFW